MYILSLGTVVEKLFRNIFFLIDDVIYRQIPKIYDLLITIARTSPLSQANIADLASRIYKLLAVFMMFKVILSLIMYVVNPDDFSDKSKGVSKLVTNIVISLALLVLTPYFFSYAYQFQTIILEDNALATIVFGNDIGEDSHVLQDAGKQIAYLASSPFLTPNLEYFACSIITIDSVGSDGKVHTQLNPDCFGFSDVYAYYEKDSECMERVDDNSQGFVTLCGALDESKSENDSYLSKEDVQTYAAGVLNGNFNLTFRKKLVTAMYEVPYHLNKTKVFAFDYSFIMSTIVGVVTLLFLITTCMDVALRSIKLAFLQLIAPIPILSYIDPKSGKDGMFKKWYQLCLKTYLALFLKLLALYFAIYIISKIGHMVDIIDGSYVTNGLIKIFIIIGALMFAKNFTKILESLGVKLDGGFQLNPFKKLENEALGMKKPAAFANKLAKGILTSPVSGLQTLGKKTIGGIDAAKNGKGFKQGWNRTHGSLYNAYHKKLDEWAPDSAEARKQERQGREEVKFMNHKWNEGKKKADKLRPYAKAAGKSDVFSALDGENKAAYSAVYKNKEFIASRMNLDKADETRKALTRISEATARGVSLSDAIEMERKNDPKGKNLNWAKMDEIKKTNDMNGFIKMRDDNAKAVAGMEKVHESIRKQYQEDAATEDQLKFVKYNEIDPTEPTKKKYDKSVEQEKRDEKTDDDTKTDSSTSESANTDSSTNTESNDDYGFKEMYKELDDETKERLSEFEQSVTDNGAPSGEKMYDSAAERRKKIDEEINKLIEEYNNLGDSPSDKIRKNELRRLIEQLENQR